MSSALKSKETDTVGLRLAEANGRLRANKYAVTIQRIGDRLYLRATLPPRPGSTKTEDYQQRISIAKAHPQGVQIAEAEAKAIRVLLDKKIFSWEPYLKNADATNAPTLPQTVDEWVGAFEEDYFQRRKKDHKSLTTWEGDYNLAFCKLPAGELLTVDLLKNAILKTDPDTRTRKRFCIVLGALARFAGLDFNPKPLAGKYSPKRVLPRNLPEDSEIVEWYYKIKNPCWQWVYGILATYGLRNHEVFFVDWEQLQSGSPIVSVTDGKTGFRRVWPCHPEWFEQFNLQQVQLPPIDINRPNKKLGMACTKYLRKTAKLPFQVYNLRHCWAIRTLEYGLDVTLAAQQMGHSVAVHTELYHHWITERHHQRAFELLMLRPDRPQPPPIPEHLA